MSSLVKTALAIALVAPLVPSAATAQPRHHKARMHHAKTYQMPRSPALARGYAYGYAPYAAGYGPDTGPYGPNSADPYPLTAADNPYNPYAPPGAAIRALSRRNQYAPGVTNELAPDNIATASGGPSGGVPGFSSH